MHTHTHKRNILQKKKKKKKKKKKTYPVPVVISKGASHDIRDTAYATSLESTVSNRPRYFQYAKNTTLPVDNTT